MAPQNTKVTGFIPDTLIWVRWIGIALLFFVFIFGWAIVFNFGTLLRIGFFVLGLAVAKRFIFGR